MNEQVEPADDIGIIGVLSLLWHRKVIIAAATALGLAAAVLGYMFLPRIYESNVDIRPIRQVAYSSYLTLVEADIFPQSRRDLFDEYISYVQDRTLLAEAALKTDIVPRQGLDEAAYRENVLLFVNSINFAQPDKEVPLIRMSVRSNDPAKLRLFVTTIHAMAKQQFSSQLHLEITNRLNAKKEAKDIEARVIVNEMQARRDKAEAERKDGIERLQQQAQIARLLDLDKPLGVRTTTTPPQTDGVSVQILGTEGGAIYLQGYLALEEQIKQLKTRQNNDPFVAELRQLEQQEFQIRNDPTIPRLTEIVERLGWAAPEGVDVAHVDTANLTARKVFPRLGVFAPLGVLLGFLIGVALVLLQPVLQSGKEHAR